MVKWKSVYGAAWVIIIMLLVVYLVAYAFGADYIYVKGIHLGVPNSNTYQLYQINDTTAIEITEDGFIEAIGYERTKGLEALAGKYSVNGDTVFMPTADYLQGDYIYTAYPGMRTSIINIRTGEVVESITDSLAETVDLSKVKEYQERGLTGEEQYRLTKEIVEQQFKKLDTFDENRFTIILAFSFVIGVMLILGIIMTLRDIRVHKSNR